METRLRRRIGSYILTLCRARIQKMVALLLLMSTMMPISAAAQSEKIFVFGNSLINHVSDTEKTTVPYWLGVMAKAEGRSFELDGQFGFLRNFHKELPPSTQWSFSTVTKAWQRKYRNFEDVGYDTILFNPTNFIQYQPADRPYDWDNPTQETPLSVTVALLEQVSAGKQVLLYEGWADMGTFVRSFPPNNRRLRKYHAFNRDAFHDWHLDYANMLQDALPDLDIQLVPVARILGRAFTETDLSEIPVTDLYTDDAPHGTPLLYYLAAVPTYSALFGVLPPAPPAGLDPRVAQNFDAFLKIIREEFTPKPRQKAEAPKEITPAAPAVATQASEPSEHAGLTPALGFGLNGISDWSTQMPFVDLMKTARPWVGHFPGQFGGLGENDLRAGGYLDPQGWPKSIPKALTRIETFVLSDLPKEATQQAGVYRLTYDGQGKVDIGGRGRALRYGDNEIWFRFSPGEGVVGIAISETDPAGTGDYVRNISVVREDQIPLFDAGVIYNPEWLQLIKDARLLRFMDWMQTNGATTKNWKERAQVSDYSYARRGVPLELMVDLVNQVGADPWFNMPHMADDAYVRAFAEYVQTYLRAGLVSHVEYSNEMWNFMFPQTRWAVEQAEILWNAEPGGDAWMQFYGHRAAQVAAIWGEVFASDMPRLKRVVATHTDWPGLEEAILKAPLATQRGAREPSDFFDAYAVTGYFGHAYGSDEKLSEVLDWIAESQAAGLGIEGAIQRMSQDIAENSLRQLTQETWPYHAKIAARYGLDLMMYEGGTHLVGLGEHTENEDLTAFLIAANYSPEMAGLYQQLLTGWDAVGGQVFNAFVDVANPTRWGSWGTLRHLGDANARADVLAQYNANGPGWAEMRAVSDFQSGAFANGTAAADQLTGTAFTDVLMGGDGDDEFLPGQGKDHLHGGAGNDHVVLSGFLEEYQFRSNGSQLIATSEGSKVTMVDIETLSFSKSPNVIIATSDLF